MNVKQIVEYSIRNSKFGLTPVKEFLFNECKTNIYRHQGMSPISALNNKFPAGKFMHLLA